MLADITAFGLGDHLLSALEVGGDFRISAVGGVWIGQRVRYRKRGSLSVRTFVAPKAALVSNSTSDPFQIVTATRFCDKS